MCLLSGEVKYRSQRLNLNPSQRKQTVALSSDKIDIVFSTGYCFLPVRQSLRRITTPNQDVMTLVSMKMAPWVKNLPCKNEKLSFLSPEST